MDEPQYKPPKRFPWSATVACLGMVLILGMLLLSQLQAARFRVRFHHCETIVFSQCAALRMYATDYEDHLPPASQWHSAVLPYLPHQQTDQLKNFSCPEITSTSPGGLGYAMNRRQSGLTTAHRNHETNEILLFETSNVIANANDAGETFTARHEGYGLAGFVDGHVRALTSLAGR